MRYKIDYTYAPYPDMRLGFGEGGHRGLTIMDAESAEEAVHKLKHGGMFTQPESVTAVATPMGCDPYAVE